MAPRYGCGDKVFAKVRGYPPWPARVDSIADSSPSNIKYHVFFYGTLERGVCRNQDLFPYQENKEKLSKPIKRKDFQRAINQIEGIEPVPQLVPFIAENFGNGGVKEFINNCKSKSNTNVEGNDIEKKKNSRSRKTALPVTNENGTLFNLKGIQTEESKAKKCSPKTKLPVSIKTCSPSKIGKPTVEKIKIPKPSSATFECSKPNSLPLSLSEATSRSGRIIKRKVFADEIESPPSKRKKEEVSPQQKQASVPSEKKKDPPTSYPSTPRKEAKRTGDNSIVEVDYSPYANKPSALEWLTTENCMTRLDTLIRGHLGMSRANPKQCIETLDSMCNLKLKPLMLKKHPEVVETIKRLRKYVGNAGAWNFSVEQQREFEEQAQEIRAKAECIFDKFKKMFSAPDNSSFLEIFADSVLAFQKKTEDWPLAKIYSLTTEPKIRKPQDKTSSEHKPTEQCKNVPVNLNNHNSSERLGHIVPSINGSDQRMSNATPIRSAEISSKYNGNHPSPKKKPVTKTKRQTKKTTEKKEKSISECTKQKSNQGNKRGRKTKVIK